MSYYFIKPDIKIPVDQASAIAPDIPMYWQTEYSMSNLGGFYDGKLDKIIVPEFKLKGNYRATDYVSSVRFSHSLNMLVSQRLFNLVVSCRWERMHIYRTKCYHRNTENDYFMISMDRQYEYFDYSRTIFKLSPYAPWPEDRKYEPMNFKNHIEYRDSLIKGEISQKIENPKLIDPKLDLFCLPLPIVGAGGIFVSEDLKDKIESAKMTGMRFEPADEYFS